MATGTVTYWNGSSGWITQKVDDGVSTYESRDIMFVGEDVVDTGLIIAVGLPVTFVIEGGVAKNLTGIPETPEPEPPVDSPPEEAAGNSPQPGD